MRIKVFISYSHRDKKYLKDNNLLGFIKGLENQNVSFWWDEKLCAGDIWDIEIKQKIKETHIALVLVSQWFLNSSYCTKVEITNFLKECRDRGLIIFPVILSACDWQKYEWLKTRQFLPGGNKTIEEHYIKPGQRKRLFVDILQDLEKQIKKIRNKKSSDESHPPTLKKVKVNSSKSLNKQDDNDTCDLNTNSIKSTCQLIINQEFHKFSEEAQIHLNKAIGTLLNIGGVKIEILKNESVSISTELSSNQAQKVFQSVKKKHGVVDIKYKKKVKPENKEKQNTVKTIKKGLKIAIFSWETLHSISVGDIGNHVTELGAALERKNHEVHIFTRIGSNQKPYEKIHGVHYHRCPFPLNPNFIQEINGMCQSFVHHFLQIENQIGHFDIIHAHDWLASNCMIWIKQGKGMGKKAIFTIHSTEYGRCGNNFWNGQSTIIREHEKEATHHADRVITVSNKLKKEIMWMYDTPRSKISVVYNGINVHNFDREIDPKEIKKKYKIGPLDPTILFVGRMTYQKAPDLLVEAIPYVLSYYPAAKFLFVGDGDMKVQLEQRAQQIGIANATRFLGYRSGTELQNLYKACDGVCIPSRNEPFGIVILEAWGAGKPVITTVNGGPSEFIWHDVTGLKIYDNPDSIAWGIGTLLADLEHARWMGKNGRIAAANGFSWDTIANKVLEVYYS